MEKRTTIFDYLGQTMIVFGFSMVVLNLLCLAFGEDAKDFSAMFALGGQGIPTPVVFQYLLVSALIAGLRFLFFTDRIIKKMSIARRTVGMLASVLVVTVAFITLFRWFPVTMWQPWAAFFLSFGISVFGSYQVMAWKERMENQKMAAALRRLQNGEKREDG